MMKRFRRGAIALGMILAGISGQAKAQTAAERSGARAAATAGLDAFKDGKYDQAADYFDRAESLMHAPTHLLYLARSNAKLGKLVIAREYYLKLSQERLAATASKPFRDAQASAEKELAELEPRVPYLTVQVKGGGAKDVQVTRDGEPMPVALVGVPHPEDPGNHTFSARADGMESAPSSVLLKESARETVVLTLQASASAPAAAVSPNGSSSTGKGSAHVGFGSEPTAPDEAGSSGTSALRVLAYTGMGLGAVGLGIGGYFLVKSNDTRKAGDALTAACAPTVTCRDPKNEEPIRANEADEAQQRTMGAVGLIAGGALFATGVSLLIVDLASSHRQEARLPNFQPLLTLNSVGVLGRF